MCPEVCNCVRTMHLRLHCVMCRALLGNSTSNPLIGHPGAESRYGRPRVRRVCSPLVWGLCEYQCVVSLPLLCWIVHATQTWVPKNRERSLFGRTRGPLRAALPAKKLLKIQPVAARQTPAAERSLFGRMGGPLGAAAMRSVLEPVVTSGKPMYRIWAWKSPPRSCLSGGAGAGGHIRQAFAPDLDLGWVNPAYRVRTTRTSAFAFGHTRTWLPALLRWLAHAAAQTSCPRLPCNALPAVVILRDKVEQDRFVVR